MNGSNLFSGAAQAAPNLFTKPYQFPILTRFVCICYFETEYFIVEAPEGKGGTVVTISASKRFLCIAICIGFVAVSLLSGLFVSTHAIHDCTGDHCTVCAQIHQAQSLLRQFGASAVKAMVSGIALSLLLGALLLRTILFPSTTPVSQSIRLNN